MAAEFISSPRTPADRQRKKSAHAHYRSLVFLPRLLCPTRGGKALPGAAGTGRRHVAAAWRGLARGTCNHLHTAAPGTTAAARRPLAARSRHTTTQPASELARRGAVGPAAEGTQGAVEGT